MKDAKTYKLMCRMLSAFLRMIPETYAAAICEGNLNGITTNTTHTWVPSGEKDIRGRTLLQKQYVKNRTAEWNTVARAWQDAHRTLVKIKPDTPQAEWDRLVSRFFRIVEDALDKAEALRADIKEETGHSHIPLSWDKDND